MIKTYHLIPPLDRKYLSLFSKHRNKFLKYLDKLIKAFNKSIPYEHRKYRITGSRWHTLKATIDSLANSYIGGTMRNDGYYFTSNSRTAHFSNKAHKRTGKRHISKLLKCSIIKHIDYEKIGADHEVSYGFWVRLADWIVEELIHKFSEKIYELQAKALEPENILIRQSNTVIKQLITPHPTNGLHKKKQARYSSKEETSQAHEEVTEAAFQEIKESMLRNAKDPEKKMHKTQKISVLFTTPLNGQRNHKIHPPP